MDFNYFYGRGADQFVFYQITKILIKDGVYEVLYKKTK